MRQAALDLNPLQHPAAATQRGTDAACADSEGTGFQIGWDHAHHALVPPPELLLAGTPVCQGWMAGRAVFGKRTLAAGRSVRLWLALRTLAWRRGIAFDALQVTPNYLAQIHAERCPVLRQPLGGAAGQPLSAVVERLNPQAGYAAGNLVTMSLQAAQARQGLTPLDAVRRARAAETAGQATGGLDAGAWWRLAALAGFAQTLPFFEAAGLPLAVLPPNRVRVLNAVQGLQALVTQLFARPGWAARARALGAMLPAHTLRHDFNLFVGAVAPRVLEAGAKADADSASLRQALEDAWLNERVQRRWQHLVLSLGEAATADLLERAASAGLAGMRTLTHAPEQATEGWGLQEGGRTTGRRVQDQRASGIFTAPRPARNRSATTGARLS
jgi:hypothetical protein